MIARLAVALLCAGTALGAGAAQADDDELDRIPAPTASQQANTSNADEVFFLQNDVIGTARRSDLPVAFPPPFPARWEERLFADARINWQLSDDVSLYYSGRLNLRAEDGLDVPSHENIRHDFREGYLAWKAGGATFLDIGRINLKSGVALGFNPTDFFKTRAVVEPLSADPSVLREDRLGTLMVFGQHLWENASLSVAFAPKVTNPSPIYRNDNLPSFNPMLDRTNAETRFLAKGSARLFDDFAPELVLFSNDGHWSYGTNITHGIGQKIVAYAEWAGGNGLDLADEALQFGKDTGTIPPAASSPLPSSTTRRFESNASVGFSYTTESKITFNLEYHYHQAGFSDADWTRWFGAGALGNPALDAELWYIRGYAADQGVPTARQEAFLRADWVDAFVEDLEITAFINADLRDASSFSQVTADYYLSREWTIGGLAAASFGGKRTDYGSLPSAGTFLVRVSRYF
ncbi:MAG TPA: hypothetical protein VMU22_00090 [Rhizomicrobium sp.]|nr:hypothetical protein [Rhizomicrobium sp.]